MTKMFSGQLAFLSNFYPSMVTLDGVWYGSVEHAYQAAKTLDKIQRIPFQHSEMTAGQAKRAGRALTPRPDWEVSKVPIMRLLLASKFSHSTGLAVQLLDTRDLPLGETNTWHDNEWGDCLCGRPACVAPGKNLLGISLMRLRDFLIGIG